ncbi:PilZ domain-containing protein [Thiovibrio frasassiensis]|uniref:PilZ domain-containing protein n=1 Tax=Thiovibrio frasassiensis TaxID=2984131 RepID=A0A9X4MDS5_9BACT|nr:PilZ domain-containing protein [Thiovibrio frasassiensis]MDG4474717.1 PilZ domain-containing protein [Thiovibrio frasassiensis]
MMVQEESSEERRQDERVGKNLRVRFTRLEDLLADIPYREGQLLDISGGGLCFMAEEALPLGSQLVMVLEFPGWHAVAEGKWIATKVEEDVGVLRAVGMVSWVANSRSKPGGYETGVSFSGKVSA